LTFVENFLRNLFNVAPQIRQQSKTDGFTIHFIGNCQVMLILVSSIPLATPVLTIQGNIVILITVASDIFVCLGCFLSFWWWPGACQLRDFPSWNRRAAITVPLRTSQFFKPSCGLVKVETIVAPLPTSAAQTQLFYLAPVFSNYWLLT
jgi:hypothetical protein